MNFLRYRNYGWMLIATILIATSFPVGFAITQSLNSIVLIFIRFLFASILFVPILIWKSQLFLPSWKDLSRYSILSFVVVGFFWCMFESLKYTTAINTGVIYTVVPGIAGIYEWFLLKNKFTLKRFIALILGVIGSACVIVQGNFSQIFQMQWNRGDLIFLVGCLFMGIYTPLVKFLHRKEPIIVMTFWTLVTSTCWLLILAIPLFSEVQWKMISWNVWGGIFYLALFSTVITFILIQYCTLKIGATKVMAYSYLNPVCILGIDLILGKGVPETATLFGAFIVLIATIVIQFEKRV